MILTWNSIRPSFQIVALGFSALYYVQVFRIDKWQETATAKCYSESLMLVSAHMLCGDVMTQGHRVEESNAGSAAAVQAE